MEWLRLETEAAGHGNPRKEEAQSLRATISKHSMDVSISNVSLLSISENMSRLCALDLESAWLQLDPSSIIDFIISPERPRIFVGRRELEGPLILPRSPGFPTVPGNPGPEHTLYLAWMRRMLHVLKLVTDRPSSPLPSGLGDQ